VELSIQRILFAWIAGFLIHAVVMDASRKYGSPRGYFLIGGLANAVVFFTALLVLWPALGL
jgi:hypothetical protein